ISLCGAGHHTPCTPNVGNAAGGQLCSALCLRARASCAWSRPSGCCSVWGGWSSRTRRSRASGCPAGSSRPQARVRDGPEPVSQWDRLVARIDDDAALEPVAASVTKRSEPLPVLRVERCLGLDLDGREIAGAVFEDEIDVLTLALIVVCADRAVGPRGVLEQLRGDERLAGLPGYLAVALDPLDVRTEQIGEHAGIADVDLRPAALAGAEARSPCGQALDQEHLLEQRHVGLDGVVVHLESPPDGSVGEQVRRLGREQP